MPRLYACGSDTFSVTQDDLNDDSACHDAPVLVGSDCALVAACWTHVITRSSDDAVLCRGPSSRPPTVLQSARHFLGHDSFDYWINNTGHVVCSRTSNESKGRFSLAALNARGEFLGFSLADADDAVQLRLYRDAFSIMTHDPLPVTIVIPSPEPQDFIAISAGASHFLLLTSTGAVYAYGDNRFSQLGVPTHTHLQSNTLVHVEAFEGVSPIRTIASGDFHNVVITQDGDAYVFGSDKFGQCGGLVDSSGEPQLLALETDVDEEPIVRAVSCGPRHTVVVTDKGVWVSGSDEYGQLGRSSLSKSDVSKHVREFERSQSLSDVGHVNRLICTRNRTYLEVEEKQYNINT
ncbi:hypothetical protein ACM66B_000324 [Microbotryomycetes sp. NB124-2]